MTGDFLVKSGNPQALDRTLNSLGGIVLEGIRHDGCCVVRPMSAKPTFTARFLKYAITNQGYGEVIGDAPDPAPWDNIE